MVLLRGSWVTEFPTPPLNFKGLVHLICGTRLWVTTAGFFATNRLLSLLLCAILYVDDKVSEARRIYSSALSRFGFGRLEGLISSSSPFLPVQASIAAQHHLGNACRILPEIHQGDHELFFTNENSNQLATIQLVPGLDASTCHGNGQ